MKAKCKVSGCNELHHAHGYCNRHAKKYRKYGDPLEGKTNKTGPRAAVTEQPDPAAERRPVIPRVKREDGKQMNFAFQLNKKMIERLYQEAVKAMKEPLYKATNGDAVEQIFSLAIALSGCRDVSRLFMVEIMDDLNTWAGCRDKIQFLNTLENWEEKAQKFEPKKVDQMNIFQFTK